MDLRTESLDFKAFMPYIFFFLTADRRTPHGALSQTYPLCFASI